MYICTCVIFTNVQIIIKHRNILFKKINKLQVILVSKGFQMRCIFERFIEVVVAQLICICLQLFVTREKFLYDYLYMFQNN